MKNFEYTIKPIKTEYAGVVFRSRLEATWAAFFDLMGWKWDYEPIDLDGWSPDFILRGSDGMEVFVEVKPVTQIDQLSGVGKYISGPVSKDVPLSNCLVVGLYPFITPPDEKHYYPFERYVAIGWMYNQSIDDWDEICFKPRSVGNTSGTLYNILSNSPIDDWKSFITEQFSDEIMDAWKMAKYETSFLKQST